MSDLSARPQLVRSPLGVAGYFDEALFAREMQVLFAGAPRYVGHRLAVPEVGDYFALPQEQEGRVLVHTAQGIELVSNVCRHRQALICRGRGSLLANSSAPGGSIVCPIHRWTYSPGGKLLGAPQFARDPCLDLTNYPIQEWNGLLFECAGAAAGRKVAAELAGLGRAADLDFTGYTLDRVEMHECDYNWKTFIEVYLEDYHVEPFHPGLGRFVTCADLAWEFRPELSVQTVGVSPRLGTAGSPVYERWHDALLRYGNGAPLPYGAIWLTYYPGVMVEWYPYTLTVSTLVPMAPQRTLNVVEFFYPEEITAFEREFVQAQQSAYLETVREDDEIARRMDAGRRALMSRGDDASGPYQTPMEDGMQHFHEWYCQRMDADSRRFLAQE
jgi:phenylpropionate dioxygenase-like ring-hydroxylating dioxygenase large terminal subunit